jgi:hypothetical protein
MDKIHLARDRIQRLTLPNTVTILGFREGGRTSFLAERLSKLSYTESVE